MLTFHKPNAEQPIRYAEADGYSFRVIHHDGVWYLKVSAGLGTEVALRTLTECRAVAERFLATVASTTTSGEPGETVIGNALFAAVEFVNRPAVDPSEPVELDAPAPVTAGPVVVIACGAAKLDAAAPAGELYTSSNFRLHRRAAEALAARQGGRVLILSALHGLVDPATVLAPYNVKMGDAATIAVDELAEQVAALAPSSVTALLPKAYAAKLAAATALAGGPAVDNLFAGAAGVGYQRGVAAAVLRGDELAPAHPAEPVGAQLGLFAA